MTFLRIVIPLYLFDLSMIFSENRHPLFRIMLQANDPQKRKRRAGFPERLNLVSIAPD
jgi:hypothetical protein